MAGEMQLDVRRLAWCLLALAGLFLGGTRPASAQTAGGDNTVVVDPGAPGSVAPPSADPQAGGYELDLSSPHLKFRDASYRWGLALRTVKDGSGGNRESGLGIWLQGPNWYRDVDKTNAPDPKFVGGWRVGYYDFDYSAGTGLATVEEGFQMLTVGVGADYFFNPQWRTVRDPVSKKPLYDPKTKGAKMARNNSLFLSAWVEGFFFLNQSGTSFAITDPSGTFNNNHGGLSLGLGYQIANKFRIGLENGFVSGPFQTQQLTLGTSF